MDVCLHLLRQLLISGSSGFLVPFSPVVSVGFRFFIFNVLDEISTIVDLMVTDGPRFAVKVGWWFGVFSDKISLFRLTLSRKGVQRLKGFVVG